MNIKLGNNEDMTIVTKDGGTVKIPSVASGTTDTLAPTSVVNTMIETKMTEDAVTKSAMTESVSGLSELPDSSSQGQIRTTLNNVIAALKAVAANGCVALFASFVAMDLHAIDSNTKWENVPGNVTVQSVVTNFVPTNTAQLVNGGADGTHPYVSSETVNIGMGEGANPDYRVEIGSGADASRIEESSSTHNGEIRGVAIGANAGASAAGIAIGPFATSTNSTGTSSGSVAIGLLSAAPGKNSVAIGEEAGRYFVGSDVAGDPAMGSYSVAVGTTAHSPGDGAVAIGQKAAARSGYSIAIGTRSSVTNDLNYAIAIGVDASTYTALSIVLGHNAKSYPNTTTPNSSKYGIAIGNNAVTYGSGGISIGGGEVGNASFSTNESVAIGTKAVALSKSVAIGSNAKTLDYSAISIGENAVAGTQSTSIGKNAVASNTDGISIGNSAISSNQYGIAIGSSSKSLWDYGISIGAETKSGTNAIAIGRNSVSTNSNGVAIGYKTYAGAHAYASGYDSSAQSQSVAIGYKAKSGQNSVSVGYNAVTEGYQGSAAVGPNSLVTAHKALAYGYRAKAFTEGAIALGSWASASGIGAVALGGGKGGWSETPTTPAAMASAAGAIQLGSGSNSTANTLKFRDYTVVDANGQIPTNRMTTLVSLYGGLGESLANLIGSLSSGQNEYKVEGSTFSDSSGNSYFSYNLSTENGESMRSGDEIFAQIDKSTTDITNLSQLPHISTNDVNKIASDPSMTILKYTDGTIIVTNFTGTISSTTITNKYYLEYVKIGNTVTSIGDSAFLNCQNIINIIIPDSVTTIGNQAFKGTLMKSIDIPNSVISLGDNVFESAAYLNGISLGNGIRSIGGSAFHTCQNLKTVIFPNSLKNITGTYHFYGSGIETVVIPDSVTSDIVDNMFLSADNIKTVIIGNGVKNIFAARFSQSLESITIGNGVTNIHQDAFKWSTNIKRMVFPGKSSDEVKALPNYPWGLTNCKFICGKDVNEEPSITEPVGKYPLFIIDLNPSETRFWNSMELKATTNNWANASTSNMMFFTSSSGNGTPIEGATFTNDWCRLFILSKRADPDVRKWTRITSTDDLGDYAPLSLAVIVDPEMFRRNQGDGWLSETNDAITWSYTRIGLTDHERDQDGKPCWRPIMPVRWYAELPDWAKANPVKPDSTNVTPYVPPWMTAIEETDTSYKWFGGLTNVNQSIQYVTLGAGQTDLNIKIPEGNGTKDWIVYVITTEKSNLVLPSATWWMSNTSFTNAIEAATPTALYFSQVTNGVFTLSRQEMTAVSIP